MSAIRLQWKSGAFATAYQVWRNTTDTTVGATMIADDVLTTTYDDTGLTEGATYYYFIKTKNALGTSAFGPSSGAIVAGSLLKPPTGLYATVNSVDEVTLNWTAVAGATKYDIYKHTADDSGAASLLAANVAAVTYIDTGASADTPLYYWVKAKDDAGHVSAFSKTGLGLANIALPATPADLTATTNGAGFVELGWAASARASGYEVFRDGVKIGTTTSGYFLDDDLDYHVEYDYKVRAFNYTGYSAFTDEVIGTAWEPVPTHPTDVAASDGAHPVKVVVTWSAIPYADSYDVYIDGSFAVNVPSAGYDHIVASGSSHTYKVKAVGESGTSLFSNEDTGYADSLAAPEGVTATENNLDYVLVEWEAVPGATTYQVFRNGVLLADELGFVYYADETAVPGTIYSYTVKAYANPPGELSPASVADDGERIVIGTPEVTASEDDLDEVTVSWLNVASALSYNVYRNGGLLASGVTDLEYVDDTGDPGTTYTYGVEAVRDGNISDMGTDTGARTVIGTPSVAATDTDIDKVEVSWAEVTDALSYNVYRDGGLLASGVTALFYNDTTATPTTTYTYGVEAVRADNVSDLGTDSGLRPRIASPANVDASDVLVGEVEVTWNAVTGAASYNVYRDGVFKTNTASLSWSDTTGAACQEYIYEVEAVSGSNVSFPSGDYGMALGTGDVCAVGASNSSSIGDSANDGYNVCGSTTVSWYFNAYGVADQIDIYLDGGLVATFSGSGETNGNFAVGAGSHSIQVVVTPGVGSTTWLYSLSC